MTGTARAGWSADGHPHGQKLARVMHELLEHEALMRQWSVLPRQMAMMTTCQIWMIARTFMRGLILQQHLLPIRRKLSAINRFALIAPYLETRKRDELMMRNPETEERRAFHNSIARFMVKLAACR